MRRCVVKEREIILTESELRRCQAKGLLTQVKGGVVRLLRGPRRLLGRRAK
jgi:hypothetical protein